MKGYDFRVHLVGNREDLRLLVLFASKTEVYQAFNPCLVEHCNFWQMTCDFQKGEITKNISLYSVMNV